MSDPKPPASPSGRLGLVQQGGKKIGRQIVLPWSRAIEISYKSVMIRFWRSMITAAGIVLAIAFLMATLTRGAVVESMKGGIPTTIKSIQDDFSAHKKTLQDKATGGEPKFAKVYVEIQKADMAKARKVLDDALKADDGLKGLPEVATLKSGIDALQESGVKLKQYEDVRLEMLQRGESPHALAGETQEISPEETEAASRDKWLITLALLVALVGITNAMLMSVTERFREIGTMKCLGALDSFIVKLFLIESCMQGFMGTLIGIIVGLLFGLVKLSSDYGWPMWNFLPAGDLGIRVAGALICGTLLALVGAIIPAQVAARMEPAVAMRVDQ